MLSRLGSGFSKTLRLVNSAMLSPASDALSLIISCSIALTRASNVLVRSRFFDSFGRITVGGMRGGIQRGKCPPLASLSSERSEVCRRQKARLASSQNAGVTRYHVLRKYGGTARGWGRGDDSEAGGTGSGHSGWDEER